MAGSFIIRGCSKSPGKIAVEFTGTGSVDLTFATGRGGF